MGPQRLDATSDGGGVVDRKPGSGDGPAAVPGRRRVAMKRPVPSAERGAALLAVLLLVAVTGAIAAAAMEKLRLSRAVAVNAAALDLARGFAGGIEQLALVTIDDMTRRGEA